MWRIRKLATRGTVAPGRRSQLDLTASHGRLNGFALPEAFTRVAVNRVFLLGVAATRLYGPGRRNLAHTCVGDRLSHVLVIMHE